MTDTITCICQSGGGPCRHKRPVPAMRAEPSPAEPSLSTVLGVCLCGHLGGEHELSPDMLRLGKCCHRACGCRYHRPKES